MRKCSQARGGKIRPLIGGFLGVLCNFGLQSLIKFNFALKLKNAIKM
jgi:hypothetical protein